MGFARTILVAVLWSASAFAAATDPPVRELCRHGDLVRWVGFSPDGRIVASAGFDGAIRWTHLGSGNPLKVLPGSDKKVWGAFSAVGTTFAAGSWDPTIRVWVAPAGTLRQALTSPHTAAWAGAMSSDGKTLVSGGPEGTIAWWDAKLGVTTHTTPAGAPVWWVSLSPAGDEVAAGCQDGQVRVFGRDSTDPRVAFAEHVGGVYGVAYSPDGALIAAAGADASVTIWDSKSGALRQQLPFFGAVHTVAFSPDGKLVAAGSVDHTIKIFETATGTFVRKLAGHDEAVWCVAFSPDGKHLASAGADRRVLVWDLTHLPTQLVKPASLPPKFDLRPRMRKWGLNVVAQHGRNTCCVQSVTRALEFAVSERLGRGTPLSDEYLNWASNQVVGNIGPMAQNRGHFFEHLWMGIGRYGFCPREQMPWREQFDVDYSPSEKAREIAVRPRSFRILWHDVGGPGVKPEEIVREIKTVLASGSPVLAGSPHSVLVVGYVDDPKNPGGGRFLIADSGTGGFVTEVSGDKLHSAITYDRMADYGFSWLECIAEPADKTATTKRR